jgi:hypothetical protein
VRLEHVADVAGVVRTGSQCEAAGGAGFDQGAKVVEAHEDPQRTTDLVVGRGQLVAIEDAASDQLLDVIKCSGKLGHGREGWTVACPVQVHPGPY